MATRLLRDPDVLEGTCYFEFLPGQYEGECWKAGSLFISEEDFAVLEPAFEAAIPEFDRYAFTEPTREDWHRALSNLGIGTGTQLVPEDGEAWRESGMVRGSALRLGVFALQS